MVSNRRHVDQGRRAGVAQAAEMSPVVAEGDVFQGEGAVFEQLAFSFHRAAVAPVDADHVHVAAVGIFEGEVDNRAEPAADAQRVAGGAQRGQPPQTGVAGGGRKTKPAGALAPVPTKLFSDW